MSRNKAPPADLFEILGRFPERTIEMALKLRKMIIDLYPDLEEKAYPVWCGLGFKKPKGSYLGALFFSAGRVDLGFERGVFLEDAERVLEGEGKSVRYLRFKSESDLERLSRFIPYFFDQALR